MDEKKIRMNLQNKLSEYLFSLKKLDVNFMIAKIMIDKLNEFPDVTIEEIAYLANTTPSSVTKLCKRIGYNGFSDMRISDKSKNTVFPYRYTGKTYSRLEFMNNYMYTVNHIYQNIENYLNKKDIIEIAHKVKEGKRITIISTLFGYDSFMLFNEFMIDYNKTVYEINRDCEDYLIEEAYKKSDLVFVISLTGQWMKEKFYKLNTLKEKTVLLTYEYDDHTLFKTIKFNRIPDFFSSFVITSHSLQAFFVLLTSYLKENPNE